MLFCRPDHRRRFITITLLMLAVVSVLSGSQAPWTVLGSASANGATRVIVDDERAGPYLLRVGILPGSPKVGTLHVSVLVQDAAGQFTVSDATVMLSVAGPEGSSAGAPVLAVNQPQSPQLYEGNVALNVPGNWTLNLETDSGLGKANLAVPLEVTETTGLNSLFIVVGVVVVLVIGTLIWSQAKRNRSRTS